MCVVPRRRDVVVIAANLVLVCHFNIVVSYPFVCKLRLGCTPCLLLHYMLLKQH